MAVKCDEMSRDPRIEDFKRIARPSFKQELARLNDSIDRDFIMVFQDAFKRLTKNCKLSGGTWSVFMYIVASSGFENEVTVNQTQIAEHVGLARPNVNKCIKNLTTLGILELAGRKGLHMSYRINWEYVWKGKTEGYRQAQKKTIARKLSLVKG